MKSNAHLKQIPVLFVLPCLGTGGSERVVMNLCLKMQQDFLPVVVAFSDGALAEKLREAGVAVHVLKRCGGIDPRLSISIFRLMRRYRVQVVNTHHFVALFYAFWASRARGIPLVHTEHSRWEMEGLPRFWRFFFKFFLRRLEIVTAVSRGAYDYLIGPLMCDRAKTALILNGIDIELFQKGKSETLPRQRLGLDASDLVIGSVGNLRVEKNQALLIRTLALIKESNANIKLLLVGDGPCRQELETLARELGVAERVLFLGIRHDVSRLYGLMDIYCLPSRFEGLPLTLLEAMAAGTPIVGTDVLGIREVIQHNNNGLLAPDNDPEKLRDVLLALARQEKKRTELAARGLAQVIAEYHFDKFVMGYTNLFIQLSHDRAMTSG